MGWLSWFNYETVLAQLASEIAEAKQNLAEIRLRQRRFSLVLNAYGVALWAVWFGLWWWSKIPWSLVGWHSDDTEARVISTAVTVGAPVGILGLNRLLGWIFSRKRTYEETHLRKLLAKQRTQVDEIKKATNYDSTRKLLEQYDSPGQRGQGGPGPQTPRRDPSTPVRTPGTPPQPLVPGQQPQLGTPHAPGHMVEGSPRTPGQPSPGTPIPVPQGMTAEQAAVLQMQMQAIQPVLPTPEKRWYDRLADTILGDDPTQAPQNKYALVCSECFRHNGLIGSKYEWERMQWICPRCNHLNPPPLQRMREVGEDVTATPSTPSGPSGTPGGPRAEVETPSKPPKPAVHLRAPAPRRRPGEKLTPRSSRLGKEMVSASHLDEDGEGEGDEDESEEMDVDK